MKIAHLLPASATFPLKRHNGRYEWAIRLAKQQAMRGHSVVVYCGGGVLQSTPVELRTLDETTTKARVANGPKRARNEALLRGAFADDSIDVFHSHFDALGAELAHLTSKPVITTQHWFPNEAIAAQLRACTKPSIIVPLTRCMFEADIALGISPVSAIPHGIDLSLFDFDPTAPKNGRLLYVGRISEGKGVRIAATIAAKAHAPLDIVGKVNDTDELYYASFEQYVDGHDIAFHGPKPQAEVARMMRCASGFLFPNIHPEAFGQTIIEAQASGCPVIVSDCGANSELVRDGITGFVCRTNEDYTRAIKSVHALDSGECRRFAEKFSLSTMVEAYDNLYAKYL